MDQVTGTKEQTTKTRAVERTHILNTNTSLAP